MNFTQITAFHAAMTSASLSEAASKLGRTQPAISAAIKGLEDQLGLKLFERQGRKLVPVPEAHYLLSEAASILSQMSRVRQTMRSLVDGQSGNLSAAAMPGPVAMLFPRFVARQIAKTANLKVSLLAHSAVQIAELARAQSIDFGFADAPKDVGDERLYSAQFISGDCFLAVPMGHSLADKPQIQLADLHNEPMGTLQPTHAHQTEIRDRFRLQDIALDVMIESQTFLPILPFVSSGRCCTILDPLTIVHMQESGDAFGGIVIKPLKERIKYRYAILSPLHRPTTVMARMLRDAWRDEVIRLLDQVAAQPTIEQETQGASTSFI